MYAVKWKGEAVGYKYEVMGILDKMAEKCVMAHEYDAFASYMVDVDRVHEEINISMVTTKKETAYSMAEWMEEFAGIKMEVKEIEVSPLPFEN